jgi:drug/metabolite transporter (DMT)-like permease
MGIFATVLPGFLLAEGMRRIGASKAAIISSAGPVATIFLAYIFLGETISQMQMAGTALIIAGVLLVGLRRKG